MPRQQIQVISAIHRMAMSRISPFDSSMPNSFSV